MAKLLKKLKKVDAQIKSLRSELRETETSVYYTAMCCEGKRKQDANEIKSEIRDLLSLKFSIIESLQIEFNLIKVDISEQQRQLTLQINSLCQ